MNKIIIALGFSLAASTAAGNGNGVDYRATAAIGGQTTTQPLGVSPRAL